MGREWGEHLTGIEGRRSSLNVLHLTAEIRDPASDPPAGHHQAPVGAAVGAAGRALQEEEEKKEIHGRLL